MSNPKRARLTGAALPSDDFICFDHEMGEEEEEEEENETEDEEAVLPSHVDQADDIPKPLIIDWSCSDLTIEFDIPQGRGMILRRRTMLPGTWALARGSQIAFQGRQQWRLKVLRLPSNSSNEPNVLFGVLVQWPGCHPMPGPGNDALVQPCLVLMADTGEQFFSSNLSTKLLRSPLFPTPLHEGDCVEIVADLGRRNLRFRRGDETADAKALPVRRDAAGRGSRVSNRLRETAYCPFVALQVGVEVELLDTCPPAVPRSICPAVEAIVLVGPPGSGKSTWAAEYAKGFAKGHGGHGIHVLGVEWLRHRDQFLECEVPSANENRKEVKSHRPENVTSFWDDEAGRKALAQQIIEAFAAFPDGNVEDKFHGEAFTTEDSQETGLMAVQLQRSGFAHSSTREVEQRHCPQMAEVMPELLRRAATRYVSVIADGCHLKAYFRAELRAALLHFPGRVRWVIVIPDTVQELLDRQNRRLHSPNQQCEERNEWSGSTLPGAEGDCNFAIHDVEFAEGRDHKVFYNWLAHVCPEAQTVVMPPHSDITSQTSDVHRFFTNFGATCDLSTEGTRRY